MFKTLLLTLLLVAPLVSAKASDTIEGKITWVQREEQIQVGGHLQTYQKLTVKLENGTEVVVENGLLPLSSSPKYKTGQELVLMKDEIEGKEVYTITDVVRRPALMWLTILFVVIVLVIARQKAFFALISLVMSFGILFKGMLPQLLLGTDPIMVVMISAVIIVPVTFYLSHGWGRKTHIAVLSTMVALLLTSLLTRLFVDLAGLTGFAAEEATFLQADKSNLNIKSLLIAGMIIALLGVLDDVTVSQSSVVEELRQANPSIKRKELFWSAMRVGTDHISSVINTLVLVYVGAALPLTLLFLDSKNSVWQVINYEMVAEEIVRALTGSIGLVLAVPITTVLAVWLNKNDNK